MFVFHKYQDIHSHTEKNTERIKTSSYTSQNVIKIERLFINIISLNFII